MRAPVEYKYELFFRVYQRMAEIGLRPLARSGADLNDADEVYREGIKFAHMMEDSDYPRKELDKSYNPEPLYVTTVSKTEALYREVQNGDQCCIQCKNSIRMSPCFLCGVVAGWIAENGWCKLYEKKS